MAASEGAVVEGAGVRRPDGGSRAGSGGPPRTPVPAAADALARVHPGERRRRPSDLRELAGLVTECVRLLWALVRDRRVGWRPKAVAAAAVAFVVSPLEVIPGRLVSDRLPVGGLDDLWVLAGALRHLLVTAGYDLVREHWTGSPDGFALLLVVAGVED